MEMKINVAQTFKQVGFSYLGNTKHSVKMVKSFQHNVETYCIYLAPSYMSGYNVCPNSKSCRDACLNGCGRNKMDLLAHNGISKINMARIKKTRLFFENRDLFMRIMIYEIIKAKKRAEANGRKFAIRINGTSDISPEDFVYNGENILEIFSDVQFYDYTKVSNRIKLMDKYPNYDVTLSYNGYNWKACKEFLMNGGKVAVVFFDEKNRIPTTFEGFNVIDANDYDMRFLDPKGTIMGLHYHRVANDYVNGKFQKPTTPFIVDCEKLF